MRRDERNRDRMRRIKFVDLGRRDQREREKRQMERGIQNITGERQTDKVVAR